MAHMAGHGSYHPHASEVWLVWCFEHCQKAEHQQVRAELTGVAKAFGFNFLCFKKCMSFLSWLEGSTGSVLLVADWREAKPIMEEVVQKSRSRDVRMCVAAPSERTFLRACRWAGKQDQSMDIMVSPGILRRSVEELIVRYLEQLGLA